MLAEKNIWNDYWKLFGEMCESLEKNKQTETVTELRHAQKQVNGMTDGWYGFLEDFEATYQKNKNHFSIDDESLTISLLNALKYFLRVHQKINRKEAKKAQRLKDKIIS